MDEDRRLVKIDGEWQWVCDFCEHIRPVSDGRSCAQCGSSTFVGAQRRLGAAARNFGVTFASETRRLLRFPGRA